MKRLTSATALALCAFAAPAVADVTPQQVWDDLEAYLEGFGYAVEGQQSSHGGDLTVSDVSMGFALPDGEGKFAISMERVQLTDRGDGTVGIDFPAVMPIAVSVDADGEQVEMVIEYSHDGLEMNVSGDESEMIYDYAANSLTMRLAELVVDGDVIPRDIARLEVSMGPLEGGSVSATDNNLRVITQEVSFGDVTYSFAANEPGGDEGGVFSGMMRNVAMTGDSSIPLGLDLADMVAAVAAGFGGSGAFSHEGSSMEFAVTDRKGTTAGQSSSAGGAMEVDFSGDALRYAVSGTDIAFAMSGPEIPLPINASIAESRFDLSVPLSASEEPQDAALGFTLGGVAISEMLWNVFDPGAVLPRDPATVSVDLVAQVTPFISLLDADAMQAAGDEVPGELNAVTLEDLRIEAAGGRITGAGAFTFDNTDLTSFDGMPRPEGKIDLQVSGANGLIDRLIQMGLLAEQDAMGARMMLSMFTVPGDAPDTSRSSIEINDKGHILANGQRIK